MTNTNAVDAKVERLEPETTTEVQVFKYRGVNLEHSVYTVRCVLGEDGEPMFVAADVCRVLEIENVSQTLSYLDADELASLVMMSGGQRREMNVITEAGLYSLILRSRKPEAKLFKRWVTHDVLPSIRKHGVYMTPTTVEMWLNNPDVMIRMLEEIKTEREKNAVLTAKVKQDAPKVEYHDAVTASAQEITVADLAALLKKNGVEIGRDRLFAWMRNNKFLCSRGSDRNRPSYVSQVMGILTCHNTVAADGSPRLQPLVTPKGQTYFLRCFGIITA